MKLLAATLVTLALAVGCSSEGGPTAPTAAQPAAMPFAIEKLTEKYRGVAREVLQVSGYTYVNVDVAGTSRWTVSLQKDITEGATVSVRAFGKKSDFVSKKLARTFPELWFGIITQEEEEGAQS